MNRDKEETNIKPREKKKKLFETLHKCQFIMNKVLKKLSISKLSIIKSCCQ